MVRSHIFTGPSQGGKVTFGNMLCTFKLTPPVFYSSYSTAKGLKPRNLEREYVVHGEMDMAAPSTVSERGMTVTPVSLSDTSREIEQGMPATTLSLPDTSIEIEKDDGLRSIVRQELRKIVEVWNFLFCVTLHIFVLVCKQIDIVELNCCHTLTGEIYEGYRDC